VQKDATGKKGLTSHKKERSYEAFHSPYHQQ